MMILHSCKITTLLELQEERNVLRVTCWSLQSADLNLTERVLYEIHAKLRVYLNLNCR